MHLALPPVVLAAMAAGGIALPPWNRLSCLIHLPAVMYRSQPSSRLSSLASAQHLLFPTRQDYDNCVEINRGDMPPWMTPVKYCLASLRVDVAEYLGELPQRNRTISNISVNFGVCVPEQCQAEDFVDLLDFICAVPECINLVKAELIDLCAILQPAVCGPFDRTRFQHDIDLGCVREPPRLRWSPADPKLIAEATDNAKEVLNTLGVEPLAVDPIMEADPDEATTDEGAWGGEKLRIVRKLAADRPLSETLTIDLDDFTQLTECGFAAVASIELWMKSGRLSTLGDWHGCPPEGHKVRYITREDQEPPGRYCTLRYMDLLVAGRCVPHQCTNEGLHRTLELICQWTSGHNQRPMTCLDLINVVPLDVCLMTQLLGCGDFSALTKVGLPDFSEMLGRAVAHSLPPEEDRRTLSQANQVIQSILGPQVAQQMSALLRSAPVLTMLQLTKNESDTLLAEIADLREDFDRHIVQSRALNEISLTVKPYCDFSTDNSFSSVFRKTICVVLIAAAFCFLPLAAILSKSHEAPTKNLAVAQLVGSEIPRWRKVLGCFDVEANWNSYIRTARNITTGEFPHLCGLRAISMMWICLGHCFSFAVNAGAVSNLPFALSLVKFFDMQFVVGGEFAVDSFFFFTGFLIAVFGEPSLNKVLSQTQPSVLTYFKCYLFTVIHRYIRLSGTYFFLFALYVLGLRYIGSGPMWPVNMDFIEHSPQGGCSNNWWTNILYINNLVGGQVCFGWAWYLANDFQFFLISTALLFVRRHTRKAFRYATGMILALSLLISLIVIVQNDLRISMVSLSMDAAPEQETLMSPFERWERYYFRPWCRIPPHLIGLIAGFAYTGGYFQKYILKEETNFVRGPTNLQLAPLLSPVALLSEIQPRLNDLERGSTTQPQRDVDDDSAVANSSGSPAERLLPAASAPAETFDTGRSEEIQSLLRDRTWIQQTVKWRVLALHTASGMTMAMLVFITYWPNKASAVVWPRWLDAIYLAVSRTIWAICIGWWTVSLTFVSREFVAGKQPRCGVPLRDWLTVTIARLLSLEVFVLTASLAYGVYLIHVVLQQIFWGSLTVEFQVTRRKGNLWSLCITASVYCYFHALSFIVLSVALALPLVVCVEIPLSKLARIYGL